MKRYRFHAYDLHNKKPLDILKIVVGSRQGDAIAVIDLDGNWYGMWDLNFSVTAFDDKEAMK